MSQCSTVLSQCSTVVSQCSTVMKQCSTVLSQDLMCCHCTPLWCHSAPLCSQCYTVASPCCTVAVPTSVPWPGSHKKPVILCDVFCCIGWEGEWRTQATSLQCIFFQYNGKLKENGLGILSLMVRRILGISLKFLQYQLYYSYSINLVISAAPTT